MLLQFVLMSWNIFSGVAYELFKPIYLIAHALRMQICLQFEITHLTKLIIYYCYVMN